MQKQKKKKKKKVGFDLYSGDFGLMCGPHNACVCIILKKTDHQGVLISNKIQKNTPRRGTLQLSLLKNTQLYPQK